MALPYPIDPSEVDAKSPVKDSLMGGIKANFDELDNRTVAAKVPAFTWNLNGPLRVLPGGKRKRIDTQMLHTPLTFSKCKLALERSGISGTLEIDVRIHTRLNIPITSITSKFSDNIQSIANVAPALATQSIARNGSQIATQSITRAKAQLSVQSIISVPGGNRWRYNLNTAPDADWIVGSTVTFASCTNALNNGSFVIVEVNQSGFPSIVVINASGVAQTSAAGTADLALFSYNYTNPINTNDHKPGYSSVFASHTTGGNNGTFAIYKINQSGNNVWIYNPSGATQGTATGTLDTSFWRYTFLAAAGTPDFTVGEKAKMASHTTGANNGNFEIVFINFNATNSITVYNPAGVAQAAAAGTVNTNRWIYAMATNPTTNTSIGDFVRFSSATTPANNGLFDVRALNRLGTNNLVIYNEAGVAQAGIAGTVLHSHKIISFSSDQSANFSTRSRIEIADCPDGLYNEADNTIGNPVLAVNFGGGANYNVVIYNDGGSLQPSPAGMVTIESKSIFNSTPKIVADVVASREKRLMTVYSTDFFPGLIAENSWLGMWVMQSHTGPAESLTVSLS